MANFKSFLGGASQGAVAGAVIGGGVPGAIIGGLIGGAAGLFSADPEEQAQEREKQYQARYQAYLVNLEKAKEQAILKGTQSIGKLTGGLSSRFRGEASKRASALGRIGDVESFELPVTEKVAQAGSESLEKFLTSNDQYYTGQRLAAEQANLQHQESFGQRPYEAEPLDYVNAIAPVVTQIGMQNKYMDTMKEMYGKPQGAKDIEIDVKKPLVGKDEPTEVSIDSPYKQLSNVPDFFNLDQPEKFNMYKKPDEFQFPLSGDYRYKNIFSH